MSSYDRRYNVHYRGVSFYTDDPAEALSLYNYGLGYHNPPFIDEGYADYDDGPNDTTMVTRRTTGSVLPSTLEFIVERAAVQKMIKELT